MQLDYLRKYNLIERIKLDSPIRDLLTSNFNEYKKNVDANISIEQYAKMERHTLLRYKVANVNFNKSRNKYVKTLNKIIKNA